MIPRNVKIIVFVLLFVSLLVTGFFVLINEREVKEEANKQVEGTRFHGEIYEIILINETQTIEFKIRKSWLEQENATSEEIKLYKYEDFEWKEQELTLIKFEEEHVIFEALIYENTEYIISLDNKKIEEEPRNRWKLFWIIALILLVLILIDIIWNTINDKYLND